MTLYGQLECPCNMASGFRRVRHPRDQGESGSVFYDLASEVTLRSHIPSLLPDSIDDTEYTDIMWEEISQGHEEQWARITGDHPGGGLLQS